MSTVNPASLELAKTDLAGLHQQHAYAWSSFNTTLQIVILLETLPWVTVGTLMSRSSLDQLFTGGTLPARVLAVVLLFTGLAGSVGYAILVYNRLTILFYAHAINGYRALFADAFPTIKDFLPVSPEVPPTREGTGIMFLLSVALIVLNAIYLALAAFHLVPYWPVAAAVFVGLATIGWLWWWYHRVTARPVVASLTPPRER